MSDSRLLISPIVYLEESDVNADGSLNPSVGRGKPVVLMVQGNFCGYCTKAKPAFQEFGRSNSNVVAATVQVDGPDRGASAKIPATKSNPGVPLFLGFDRNGKFVKVHSGNRDAESLRVFANSL